MTICTNRSVCKFIVVCMEDLRKINVYGKINMCLITNTLDHAQSILPQGGNKGEIKEFRCYKAKIARGK